MQTDLRETGCDNIPVCASCLDDCHYNCLMVKYDRRLKHTSHMMLSHVSVIAFMLAAFTC